MSIQKQERLLSYNPTIIIATPGRLWELLNERANQYLVSELPMIDVLVLDEADRMIEDSHFKEMKMILDFVYNKRVEYKKQGINNKVKTPVDPALMTEEDQKKRAYKEHVIAQTKSIKDNFVLKDLEGSGAKVDLSKIVDLYDEDGIMEEISPDNLVIEESQKKEKGTFRNKKVDKRAEEKKRLEQEEQFAKEYKKMGGIQHIICSATMTIDNSGRITPKQTKKLKKQGMYA
jgi:ATP-dependent RNA helicase DDX24/MAK5